MYVEEGGNSPGVQTNLANFQTTEASPSQHSDGSWRHYQALITVSRPTRPEVTGTESRLSMTAWSVRYATLPTNADALVLFEGVISTCRRLSYKL